MDFADCGEVFAGLTVTVPDGRVDYGEDRYMTAGHLADRCVVVVWTPRADSRRIVSVKFAHAQEEARWFAGV